MKQSVLFIVISCFLMSCTASETDILNNRSGIILGFCKPKHITDTVGYWMYTKSSAGLERSFGPLTDTISDLSLTARIVEADSSQTIQLSVRNPTCKTRMLGLHPLRYYHVTAVVRTTENTNIKLIHPHAGIALNTLCNRHELSPFGELVVFTENISNITSSVQQEGEFGFVFQFWYYEYTVNENGEAETVRARGK